MDLPCRELVSQSVKGGGAAAANRPRRRPAACPPFFFLSALNVFKGGSFVQYLSGRAPRCARGHVYTKLSFGRFLVGVEIEVACCTLTGTQLSTHDDGTAAFPMCQCNVPFPVFQLRMPPF